MTDVIEGKVICKLTAENIPILRREVYLQNQTQVGTIDDVLGNLMRVSFVIELNEDVGTDGFKEGTAVYGYSNNLLNKDVFLPKPENKQVGKGKMAGRGGFKPRGDRGGRGRGGYDSRPASTFE